MDFKIQSKGNVFNYQPFSGEKKPLFLISAYTGFDYIYCFQVI